MISIITNVHPFTWISHKRTQWKSVMADKQDEYHTRTKCLKGKYPNSAFILTPIHFRSGGSHGMTSSAHWQVIKNIDSHKGIKVNVTNFVEGHGSTYPLAWWFGQIKLPVRQRFEEYRQIKKISYGFSIFFIYLAWYLSDKQVNFCSEVWFMLFECIFQVTLSSLLFWIKIQLLYWWLLLVSSFTMFKLYFWFYFRAI